MTPESISLFGQALNPHFASAIDPMTGALPAQFGYRTAGVVDIHAKGSDYRTGGQLNVLVGARQHEEYSGAASSAVDGLPFHGTGSYTANNFGIENPMPTNEALHDHMPRGASGGWS
ncbi:MAG TPA: hypothetical protein VMT92_03090 [Steroidobacteraceae bacterium]|nr:hypothetical protein [Steroidobacteraceae bacterium]